MPDTNKFLSDIKASSTPELSTKWAKVEEYYNKKLWHQLTKLLQQLIKEPSLQVMTKYIQDLSFYCNHFLQHSIKFNIPSIYRTSWCIFIMNSFLVP